MKKILCILWMLGNVFLLAGCAKEEEEVSLYDITAKSIIENGEIYKSFEPLAEDEVFAWKDNEYHDVIEIYAQNIGNSEQLRLLTNFSYATNVKDMTYNEMKPIINMSVDRKTIIVGFPLFGVIDGKVGIATKLGDSFYDFAISDDGYYVLYRYYNMPFKYYVYDVREKTLIDTFTWFYENNTAKDNLEYYRTTYIDNSFYVYLTLDYEKIDAFVEYSILNKEFLPYSNMKRNIDAITDSKNILILYESLLYD